MGRDRSLDEFTDTGDASPDTDESETDPVTESSTDSEAPEPSVSSTDSEAPESNAPNTDSEAVGSNAESNSETPDSTEGGVEPNAPVSGGTTAGGASDAEPASESDASASGVGPDSDERDGSDSPEPATATYQWFPDGVECPECGRVIEERWTHEGSHVCAECKEW